MIEVEILPEQRQEEVQEYRRLRSVDDEIKFQFEVRVGIVL